MPYLHISKHPNSWIGITQFMSINMPNNIFPKIAPNLPEVAVKESATALEI